MSGFSLFIQQQVQQSGALDHLKQHQQQVQIQQQKQQQQQQQEEERQQQEQKQEQSQHEQQQQEQQQQRQPQQQPLSSPASEQQQRHGLSELPQAHAPLQHSNKLSMPGPDLSRVGLVVWESSWLLAEFLLRVQPLGSWAGVTVVELGAGTGVTGMFLARAGAQVSDWGREEDGKWRLWG